MGLDMYLKKGKRIKDMSMDDLRELAYHISENYSKREDLENVNLEEVTGIKNANQANILEVGTYFKWIDIFEEVAYWRKANSIHNWFVQNVQEDVDDCDMYEVTKDKLEELLNLVKGVVDIFPNETKLLDLMYVKIEEGEKRFRNEFKKYEMLLKGDSYVEREEAEYHQRGWMELEAELNNAGIQFENISLLKHDGEEEWDKIQETFDNLSREKLEDIKEKLPTVSGFFFGGTEYDAWYFNSMYKSLKQLQKVVDTTDFEKEILVYQSSW